LGVVLLVAGNGHARAIDCGERAYRVTVIDPSGGTRAIGVCSVGDLAAWLQLTPESSIVGFPADVELGPLYVVRLAALEADGPRPMVQLRLYPEAPGAPRVYVAEPGYFETQDFTGSVLRGWRTLTPRVRVPADLVEAGVPQIPFPERDPNGVGRGRGPDVVSLAFVALLVLGAAAFLRRRVLARGRPDL
jgi:hypothetical protein